MLFCVVQVNRSSQDFCNSYMLGLLNASVLVHIFPCFLLMIFLVVCYLVLNVCADANTLYTKCDGASYLWQQLELDSELESDLEALDWGRKWLVNFDIGKAKRVLFYRWNNSSFINVKMFCSVLYEKSSRCWNLFTPELNWGPNIVFIAKSTCKNFEGLDSFYEVSSNVVLYLNKFTILPCMEYCCHVLKGRVLLIAILMCWMSCRNGYIGLLIRRLLFLLSPWLIEL